MQSTPTYSCTENPVLVRTAVRYRDSDSATTAVQYRILSTAVRTVPRTAIFSE